MQMSDPDLFEWTPPLDPPFQRHSGTSKDAAQKIIKHIGPLHMQILEYLRARPEGATDGEMQDGLNMNPSTQRPRRIELAVAGRIENFGCTRPTKSGRSAIVWHIRHNAP